MEWSSISSVTIESSWQKARESTDSTTTTDPVATTESGVDPIENWSVACQTDKPTEIDSETGGIDAKSVSIGPATLSLFFDAFEENARMRKALTRYDDFRAASQKLVLIQTKQLELPKNPAFPILTIECGQNGRVAILYGERTHESWCAHDGRIVVWHYRQADNIHLASCPTVARYGKQPHLLAVGAASGQILLIAEGETLSTNQIHKHAVSCLEWISNHQVISGASDGDIAISTLRATENTLIPSQRLTINVADIPRVIRRGFAAKQSTGISSMCPDSSAQSILIAGEMGAIWNLDLQAMKVTPVGADPDGIDQLLHNKVYVTPARDVKWMSDAVTAEPLGIQSDHHCSSPLGIYVFSNEKETIVYDLNAHSVIYHDSQRLQAAGFSASDELVVIDDQLKLRWFDVRYTN